MAYILSKAIVALSLGALSVIAVFVVGAITGKAEMPLHVWIVAGLIAWLGSIVFAAFGLFMGYLLPSENVMQVLGPMMAGLAAIGGLWFPIAAHSVAGTHLRGDPHLRAGPARPLAAVRRSAAPVLDREPRVLAGALRGRCRVADEQGHHPGVSGHLA